MLNGDALQSTKVSPTPQIVGSVGWLDVFLNSP